MKPRKTRRRKTFRSRRTTRRRTNRKKITRKKITRRRRNRKKGKSSLDTLSDKVLKLEETAVEHKGNIIALSEAVKHLGYNWGAAVREEGL